MKPIIYVLIAFICISTVFAVNVETNTYKIECLPEVATIQSVGFVQTCSYKLKVGSYTGDVAFCFDSLVNGRVYYHSGNNRIDISSNFAYKRYNMVKGDCYYYPDVSWVANETKVIDVVYTPLDMSKSPKWDTYFGDISANRVDLLLDPIYDANNYEIGTFRGDSYRWFSGVNTSNVDLSSFSSGLCYSQLSNNVCTYNYNGNGDTLGLPDSYYRVYSTNLINSQFHNISVKYSVSITAGATSNIHNNFQISYQDGSSELQNYTFLATNGVPVSLVINISSNASKNVSSIIHSAKSVYSVTANLATSTNISADTKAVVSQNVSSVNISLPLNVNTFQLNASFTMPVFINLSFDGSNWHYMNLSNNTLIVLTDSAIDNNKLRYKLYMTAATSKVNNFSIYFNGAANFLSFTVYDEVTGARILQNVSIIVFDSSNSYSSVLVNGDGNVTSLVDGDYTISFATANYSTRYLHIPLLSRNYSYYNISLLPLNSSQNVSLTFYNPNGATISNLPILQYFLTANGSVLASSIATDINGVARFNHFSGHYYSFSCISSVYNCNSFVLSPITESSYDILLQFLSSVNTYSSVNVTAGVSFNNVSKVLTFDYVSGNSSISNYSFFVLKNINGVDTVICSRSGSSMSDSFTCDLFGYHGLVFTEAFADGTYFFGEWVNLGESPKLFDNLNVQDSAYIGGFILLIIVLGALSFGLVGLIIGGIAGLAAILVFGLGNIVTGGFLAAAIVIGIIIAVGLRK